MRVLCKGVTTALSTTVFSPPSASFLCDLLLLNRRCRHSVPSSWIFHGLGERRRKAMAKEGGSSKQKFDSLFVLDFEATCDHPRQTSPMEVIELPCIRLRFSGPGGRLEEAARFHRYVRPVVHPRLTPFCTELTGITQEMVDGEDVFERVYGDFLEWLSSETEGFRLPFSFVTCGDWDLKTMLPGQCRLSGLEPPGEGRPHFRRWVNVKRSCHSATGHFPRDMSALLSSVGAGDFVGRQHSGIDDCENIARAARALAENGFVFDCNFQMSSRE